MMNSKRSFWARLVGCGLIGLACGFVGVGCGDDSNKDVAGLATRCARNSECTEPLVCALGRCHAECANDLDCPEGRCVPTGSANVCEISGDRRACTYTTDCPPPAVCAVDGQCRAPCQTERDCPADWSCSYGVCAHPRELVGTVLPALSRGRACGENAPCNPPFQCVDGRCQEVCGEAGACSPGLVCSSSICRSPGACTAGQIVCRDACVDPQVDRCQESCVDPRTHPTFCGATEGCGERGGSAGTPCPPGHVCANATCALSCPAGLVECEGVCIDPTSSRAFCGATAGCGARGGTTGTACTDGHICRAGSCVVSCQQGLIDCNGVCRTPTACSSDAGSDSALDATVDASDGGADAESPDAHDAGVDAEETDASDAGIDGDPDVRDAGTDADRGNPPLAATAFQTSVVSFDRVEVTWTDNATDEDSYRLERSSDGGTTWTTVATAGPGATAAVDANLAPDTTYRYRVVAVNGADATPSSEIVVNVPPSPPPPPGLFGSTGTTQTGATLHWTDSSSNEAGFRIDISSDGGATWSQLSTTGPDVTSFPATGLQPATTYRFRIVAFNAGGPSAPQEIQVTTAEPPPAAPTGFATGSVGANQVSFSWTDNATNEDGYRLERSSDGGATWTSVATAGPETTSLVDTTVVPNTTYSFRVVAENTSGDSPPSNVRTVTTSLAACATPSFDLATGSYVGVQTVQITTASAGANIRYVSGTGGPPSETVGSVVTGAVLVQQSGTLRAVAYGTNCALSSVASANYTLQAPQPVANPGPGNFSGGVLVSLASPMPGSVIRYTTNGADPSPTEGAVYGGPIELLSTVTLKAIAYSVSNAFDPSALATAAYTVTACAGGLYWNGTACVPVGPGYYSPNGDNARHLCQAGRYCSTANNATALGDGACSVGYYCPNGATSAQGGTTGGACSVPANATAFAGAGSNGYGGCFNCNSGRNWNGTACVPSAPFYVISSGVDGRDWLFVETNEYPPALPGKNCVFYHVIIDGVATFDHQTASPMHSGYAATRLFTRPHLAFPGLPHSLRVERYEGELDNESYCISTQLTEAVETTIGP